jgi:hypothetical protein
MGDQKSFDKIKQDAEASKLKKQDEKSQADARRQEELRAGCHRAVSILNDVMEPKLKDAKNNVHAGRWDGPESKGDPHGGDTTFSVSYHVYARPYIPSERGYSMMGQIVVGDSGKTLTVSIICIAYGGRTKEVRVRDEKGPLSIAEADNKCIGEWFHAKLEEYITECVNADD